MAASNAYIYSNNTDTSRPANRPPKTNKKMEMIKKALRFLHHLFPGFVARVIWYFFTKPGKSKFNKAQVGLLENASTEKRNYKGFEIHSYRWGESGPKVLLAHGWRSKIGDFRRMIEALVAQGYVVEGVDMKAHGRSSGEHTGLPEFRDILKEYYLEHAPFDAIIGYSMGGIATGVMLSEIPNELQPKNHFLIAAPPHARYFFKTTVQDIGCNTTVYDRLCGLVETQFGESIDYFDLRNKTVELSKSNIHLIYDEDDQLVPFAYGRELGAMLPDAHFVHTKGIGHYKIIAYPDVIDYVLQSLEYAIQPVSK
ncbi:MAG: alpha/beta hydrolase [Cyclobacteriaceae bacterium]